MSKKNDEYIYYWEDPKYKKQMSRKTKPKKMVFEDEIEPSEIVFSIPSFSDIGVHVASMPMEFIDKGTHILIKVKLPGFEENDVDVNIRNNVLEIDAKKKKESVTRNEKSVSRRKSSSSVRKSFSLPKGLLPEKAFAKMEKGILTIVIPKTEKKKRDWFD